VCSKKADEASLSKEASPPGRAEVRRRYAVGAGGSSLMCCFFLLGLKGPVLLCCVGSFDDVMVPEEGLSKASDSQESVLMFMSFRETFRLFLKHYLCPLIQMHAKLFMRDKGLFSSRKG